jgi:hypothetical protein
MKRIPIYFAAAAVALFWAAGGQAANAPDDAISQTRPLLRVPFSGHLPNSFFKLSTSLPLKEFEFSGSKPKSFLHIAGEFSYTDGVHMAGNRPNSYTRISTHLPERLFTDDLAQYGFDRKTKTSGRLPHSYLKIGSQYPTPKEN